MSIQIQRPCMCHKPMVSSAPCQVSSITELWVTCTQVGDTGSVTGPSGSFAVEDTRVAAGYVLHVGRAADGAVLKVGDSVTARCQ